MSNRYAAKVTRRKSYRMRWIPLQPSDFIPSEGLPTAWIELRGGSQPRIEIRLRESDAVMWRFKIGTTGDARVVHRMLRDYLEANGEAL